MSVRGRFRQTVLASLLLAITAYCIADGAILLGTASIAIAMFAWWLTEQAEPKPVPAVIVNLAVVAVLWYAVMRAFDRGVTVSDISELIIMVQLIKLFDRKSARDHAQLLLLSIFLSIGAMLTSNTLATGLVLIVYVPTIILAVMLFQIYAGIERALDLSRPEREKFAQPAPLASVGSRFGMHLGRIAAFATLGGLAASVVVFIVIPRGVGAEVLGQWGNPSMGSVTGFTDRVRLGSGGLISQSSVPVLDMAVEDKDGQHLGGAGLVYYLRGAILDKYENGQWSRSDETRQSGQWTTVPVGHEFPLSRRDGIEVIQRILFRNAVSDGQPLFASWRPSWILFEQRADIQSNQHDWSLRRRGQPGRVSYSIGSVVAEQNRTPHEERSPAQFPSRVVHQLTEEVLREHGVEPNPALRPVMDDRLAAFAIRSFLHNNYRYTLDLAEPQGNQDPIEWFLVDEQAGHCEYFASAMAVMCRSVGVQARVVTGYVAVEFNPASLHYVVRESNAHAWVEVELSKGIWREMDPTPPSDLQQIHAPALGSLAKARRWLDALTYAWNSSVVGFDESKRSAFLGGKPILGRLFAQDRGFDSIERQDSGLGAIGRAASIGGIAFVIVVVLGMGGAEGVARIRKLYRRRRQFMAAAAADPEFPLRQSQARFYAEMLQVLSRNGLAKPESRPPLAHAVILIQNEPQVGQEVSFLVRMYYKLRYASELLSDEELREVHEALGRLKRIGPGMKVSA